MAAEAVVEKRGVVCAISVIQFPDFRNPVYQRQQ